MRSPLQQKQHSRQLNGLRELQLQELQLQELQLFTEETEETEDCRDSPRLRALHG